MGYSENNTLPRPGLRGEEILVRVRKSTLARLFGVSKWTIDSWAKAGKLNIRSFDSICDFYFRRRVLKEKE